MYRGTVLLISKNFYYYVDFLGRNPYQVQKQINKWFNKEWKKIAIKYPKISSKKLCIINKIIQNLPLEIYENWTLFSNQVYNCNIENFSLQIYIR